MQQVLLVEDSIMFGRLAKSKIEKVVDVPVIWVKNYAETEEILETAKEGFSMAILDFNLPDAHNGEAIDRVVQEGISSLVFTSNMTEALLATLEGGAPLLVTTSLGICMSIAEGLDAMVKIADERLYRAKERGRNGVVF